MKIIMLTVFLTLMGICRAQWITLHESGQNTPLNMWMNGISSYFSESGSLISPSFFADSMLVFVNNPVPSWGDVWITRNIPEMAQYANVRIYADMNLDPADGYMQYYVSPDSITWTLLASTEHDVLIPFSNYEENQYLKVAVHLIDCDSVSFSFNYLKVEADTNFVNELAEISLGNVAFSVFGSKIEVNGDPESSYELIVLDVNGRKLYEQSFQGELTIHPKLPQGIYFLQIINGSQILNKRFYLSP